MLEFDTNAKTVKGEELGYFTAILYLVPADGSGIINVCQNSATCKEVCLALHGRGTFPNVRAARLDKTRILATERVRFLESLRYDVARAIRAAARVGRTLAIRINGTSDLPWIPMLLSAEFPEVTFYDYTKLGKPELRTRPNYHITYSYSGLNEAESLRVLAADVNVSVVFQVKKGKPLPETWNGYPVIDGDTHDLRFLDPKGVVVGLRAKGFAKKAPATNPFVVLTGATAPAPCALAAAA